MRSVVLPVAMATAALGGSGDAVSGTEESHFSLTYLDRIKIADDDAGLNEPSGLALAPNGEALWTVSDDTKKVFALTTDGEIIKDMSFKIDEKGLEGIAVGPSGDTLLAVREEGGEILKIGIEEERILSHHPLSEMAGYDAIEADFERGGDNKGLEGITLNSATGTWFVLKEGEPGMLIEIAEGLEAILDHKLLGHAAGFADDDEAPEDIDYSGIQYSGDGLRFWIVSDKARRLFLYDWERNEVIQSAPLGFAKNEEYREVEKAEGVAVDNENNRLYVITDDPGGGKAPRLYLFDLRF